jgi:Transposase IS4
MVQLTNAQLRIHCKKEMTRGKLIHFFGMMILATRFQFNGQHDLWSTQPRTHLVGAPKFGEKTGFSRHCFDDLWRHLKWSYQPREKPERLSWEKYRWMLVDGHVERFNEHRERYFVPSERICVDESMAHWYGQGGHWINMGLPMYVAIDRKSENGCEIQNAACSQSGVMIWLKLVKTAQEDASNHQEGDHQDDLPHGAQVLKALVLPWSNLDRTVCADSYFASVAAVIKLKKIGLRFIGVIKTAARRFPMAYLQGLELQKRGDRKGLIMRGEPPTSLLAFVWMDRDCRYFIASGSSQFTRRCILQSIEMEAT